jgi:DNA-binding PadR family transcriptional regulator
MRSSEEHIVAVREGLLALLDDGPSYGYQLKTGFEAATGGVWNLNVGQVYTTLERLERDGLVTEVPVTASDVAGTQRSYQLTEDGVAVLGAWWETVPDNEPPPRDELMLKVLLAIAHGRDHALDVITRQRSALMSLLQERRRAGRTGGDTGRTSLAAHLVSDALVVRAEADLRWLDLCEERVIAEHAAASEGGGR